MPGGFVGRSAELDRIHGCVAEVEAGHPRLVLIEGPAGIGKTRLLAEIAPKLSGWRQLAVSGDEAETLLSYGLLDRLLCGVQPDWSTATKSTARQGADP